MNKYFRAFIINILLIIILFTYGTESVNATSWIKLKPEEVDYRAEVIVYGKYDFSNSISKTQQYKGIFSPIMFKADKYYRGSGTDSFNTVIDMFDTAWVKEAQDGGASFLLFLKPDDQNKDYLIPIAGPNGMIQIINGKAKTGSNVEDAYYNNILQNHTGSTSGSKPQNIALMLNGILLLISGGFIVLRKIKGPKVNLK